MGINRILFITLSNIGDVILTLPALEYLKGNFPGAKITVMVSHRPAEIFKDNPHIDKIIIFDKHWRLREKIKLFMRLQKEHFDIIIDLRNSLYGALLFARKKASLLVSASEHQHMKERHLSRVAMLGSGDNSKSVLPVKPQDQEYINDLLSKGNVGYKDKIFVIAAGARSHIKRWEKEKFVELVARLKAEFGAKVVLVGDQEDTLINKYIHNHSSVDILDFSQKTSLAQLTCLLKRASLVVTNDSAVLHLASYAGTPTVAIFGPTNEGKYGPWSENSAIVKKDIFCRPCEKAQCKFNTLECMQLIRVEDVLRRVRDVLGISAPATSHQSPVHQRTSQKLDYKRILVARTDRIGDVLLSTPVIKALRLAYPSAYIAMIVSEYAKDIVDGNPYLDQVIIYDKDNKHKSWINSIRFALNLKKQKFDLALVLHPVNRMHLATFFAGIKKRVGYGRKFGFLLTDRIRHDKHLGQKHEVEYVLDMARYLGVEPQDKSLFMPIKKESEEWADSFLKEAGVRQDDKILAIHPGASCISKIWPLERFAQVADKLVDKYGFKVLLIAGLKDAGKAKDVSDKMAYGVVNLSGKTSVSQLASVLKRCSLFISNDSGPVHIASSLNVPVISIFGRSQKGLGPLRWGPVGEKSRFAHKAVGCVECLAHNCARGFICLKAVTVDYVLNIADSILK